MYEDESMSPKDDGRGQQAQPPKGHDEELDEIQQLLTHGVTLQGDTHKAQHTSEMLNTPTTSPASSSEEGEEAAPALPDVGQALAVYAEAAQDMATAAVELGLGRHFACADFCNQAVEKAAQAISVLRFGHRSRYDHNLRTLGAAIGAPPEILDLMTLLTPFHPEAFYADTPPEEADEVISAEQASEYVRAARTVMRWARNIVLKA
jgi:HEPN domain-containing protein